MPCLWNGPAGDSGEATLMEVFDAEPGPVLRGHWDQEVALTGGRSGGGCVLTEASSLLRCYSNNDAHLEGKPDVVTELCR